MIKRSSYSDFFLYEKFRSRQEKIVALIEECTRLKKNFLLSAPNGTGKTYMVLSAVLPVALERGLKIIFICRTHAQSVRVIEEPKKIYKILPLNLSCLSGLSIRRG